MTTALQRRMEHRMIDRCRVTADPEGADDDTFDPATGVLTRPVGDTSTIYEGKSLFYRRRRVETPATQGEAAVTVQEYFGAIPLAEIGVKVGNTYTVVASADPWAIGRPFRITEVLGETYAVTRDLKLEEWST